MAMVLTGILNQNEYYTNHYFTTIFQENAAETISAWKQDSKEGGSVTPWAAFRDTSKIYYRIREKYLQQRDEVSSMDLIEEQATAYVTALGYGEPDGEVVELREDITVPVFHEVKRSNGAPLLWVLLSVSDERGDDILDGHVYGKRSEDDEDYTLRISETNDEILATLFFSGTEAPRWIVLVGINQMALIDRNKWRNKRYLQFDMDEIFSRHEETTFQALSVLLHKNSLCPENGTSLLDILDENSYKHSSGVSDSLKYALRECIELLGNEVLHDMRTRQMVDFAENPVDAEELTIECLRYMYRVLFLLFIEARDELGFAPMRSDVYQKGYSLEGVRDVCENVRELSSEAAEGYYIDETISALFEMIYNGYPDNKEAYDKALQMQSPHDMFTIEPLKAHIFDPEFTKMINEAKLRNVTMLKIVDLMSISRPRGSRERKGRIAYSALGINQMGAVYEALLSYRGFIAEEDLYEVKRAGDRFNELDVGYFVPERDLDKYSEDERVRYDDYERRGKLRMYEKGSFIYRLAGREREKSASYYTPEVLTKCLVKYALKELLKDKSADEILQLTVCEPAMGSAAFLNEAISQLAEAYLEKKEEETGAQIAFDKRAGELQKVKMYIADRNVYGVDLNPIAVELAEVSIWLNTIHQGAHVPWFGTQLACGNSLIGARRQVYNALKLKRGTWHNEEPEEIPEEYKKEGGKQVKVYQRRRSGATYIYHFLLGDPGMANYTERVIRDLEPENIALIRAWQRTFCAKYSDEDIEILNRLSDVIDDLWMRTIFTRQQVEKRTEDSLSVFGHDEGAYEEHLTIREKDAVFNRIYKSEGGDNASPYARLKAAMDYWCALWFWPIDKADMLPDRQTFFMELSLILEGGISAGIKKGTAVGQMEISYDAQGQFTGFGVQGGVLANEVQSQIADLGVVNLEQIRELNPRLRIVEEIAKQQHFMHWELEFANLFYERGGFDLVIGNPPWIKLEWDETNVLGDIQPLFKIKKMNAALRRTQRETILIPHENSKTYYNEYVSLSGSLNYYNAKQNFYILSGQQTDLSKCFIPTGWRIGNTLGTIAMIHPNSVFDDANGGLLRVSLYKKIRLHFRFENELKLFKEVGNAMKYSLNVYSNEETPSFDAIFNLFSPITIDDCYINEEGAVEGIKDEKDNWSVKGCGDRIICIGNNELQSFGILFGDSDNWNATSLPIVHAKQIMEVLDCFSKQTEVMGLIEDDICHSVMFEETGSQEEGTLTRNVRYPSTPNEVVYSGPHIGVANPLYQNSQKDCPSHRAFDRIDLVNINERYLQRINYYPHRELERFHSRIPITSWGNRYDTEYRLCMRKMLNRSGERTLVAAIIPPNSVYIDGIFGMAMKENLSYFAGLMASVPYDFFVKIAGKANIRFDIVSHFPIMRNENTYAPIIVRSLMLNCLTVYYGELWEKNFTKKMKNEKWAKLDDRLRNNRFSNLDTKWRYDMPLRDDFSRRQALVELDVLAAMTLGMTLNQLQTLYRIQFPVLKQYENDTWYDRNGRIVFTNNRSLTNVGFSRSEWNAIKDAKSGTFTQTITDDTQPGGPVERVIEYVAPFDRCDREKDYEEVWANFEKRFSGGDKS